MNNTAAKELAALPACDFESHELNSRAGAPRSASSRLNFMDTSEKPNFAAGMLRQRRTIIALAILLVAAGIAVLFVLDRMPLPLRILVGLTDVFGGLTLLVLVRQKLPKR